MVKRSIRSLIAVVVVAVTPVSVAVIQAGCTAGAGSVAQSGLKAHASAPRAITSRVSISGIVQSRSRSTLRVFVRRGRIAGRQVRLRVLTVHLTRLHQRSFAASIVVGDAINLSGSVRDVSGSPELEADDVVVAPLPTMALAGTVSAINGTMITLDTSNFAQEGDCTEESQFVAIDASQATVSLNGAASTLSSLTIGETAVVTGVDDNDAVLATSVYGFSSAPAIAIGSLSSVAGNVLSLSSSCADDEAPSSPLQVDASLANITLNGTNGASISQLATGDFVLAIGTPGSSPIAATSVFAFSGDDDDEASSVAEDASDASETDNVSESDQASISQSTRSKTSTGSEDGTLGSTPTSGNGD